MSDRVLIIGANGQDGRILRELYKDASSVLCVLKSQTFLETKGVLIKTGMPGYATETLNDFLDLIDEYSPTKVFYLATVHGAAALGINNDLKHDAERSFIDEFGLGELVPRLKKLDVSPRLFYPGSSKMYAGQSGPINESSPFTPKCRYSESKRRAIEFIEHEIDSGGLKGITGILFHHHSHYRGPEYALSKIVSNIAKGKFEAGPYIRNWDAVEDFSDAYEVMNVVKTLMDRSEVGRFVIGSGVPRSLNEIRLALAEVTESNSRGQGGAVSHGIWAKTETRIFSDELRVSDGIIQVLRQQLTLMTKKDVT